MHSGSSTIKKVEETDREISKHLQILNRLNREMKKIEIKKVKQDYIKSNSNFHDFNNIFEQEANNTKYNLSKQEEKELKALYKKAAHMCHPDIVGESKKDDAQDIFQELNKAYVDKDIGLIKEMLIFLGDGEVFNNNIFNIDNEESLENTRDELKQKKEIIEKNIIFIKNEHEFSFIFSINDEKEYFKNIKFNLLELLNELKNYKINPIKDKNEDWVSKIYRYANKYKISNDIIPRDPSLLKKITRLDLSSKNLLYITSAISNLEFLETLNLSDNNILNIPTEFSSFINLKELNISRNKFGNIPEVIFKIKSLKKLDISKNNIHEMPEKIEENKTLIDLDLGGNFIGHITDEIYKLKSLKLLSLWGNNLSTLPDSLALLTSLEDLKVGSNNLKFLPKNIIDLHSLKNLEIFMNQDLVLSKKQKVWQLNIDDSLFMF